MFKLPTIHRALVWDTGTTLFLTARIEMPYWYNSINKPLLPNALSSHVSFELFARKWELIIGHILCKQIRFHTVSEFLNLDNLLVDPAIVQFLL